MNKRSPYLFIILMLAFILLCTCIACVSGGKTEPENGSAASAAITPSPSPSSAPKATPSSSPEPTTTPDVSEPPAAGGNESSGTDEPIGSEPPLENTSEPTQEPSPSVAPSPSSAPTTPSADPNGYTRIDLSAAPVLQESADAGQEYIDRMVFLGDSTTYGLKYYGVLSGGKDTLQVWTPTSGTLTLSYQGFADIWYPDDDVEIPIRDAVERKLPDIMVITLGVNGISFMDKEAFQAEYTDLVTDVLALSPNTKVIIQSIFPVASNYEYLSSINNTKITAANSWLLEVAENTGVRYLDTFSVLLGDNGYLKDAYQNGDGLHLNGDGFRVVLNYIRTHAL